MTRSTIALCLAAAVLSLTLAACDKDNAGGQQQQAPTPGADSPKAAVERFVEGVAEGDRAKISSAILAKPEEQQYIDAVLDFAAAGQEFRKKMLDAYGEDGWQQFQDAQHARLTLNVKADKSTLDQMTIETQGDDAATATYEGETIKLTRKDGRWYIDAGQMLNTDPGQDPAKTAAVMGKMAAVVRKHMADIGKPGMTAETIDQNMGPEIVSVLMAAEEGAGVKTEIKVEQK